LRDDLAVEVVVVGGVRHAADDTSKSGLVLERDFELGAVALDLAVFEREVELRHLRHAQIAQRLRRELHRGGRGLLPRLTAGSDELDHLVDALSHGRPPESMLSGAGRRVATRSTSPYTPRVTRHGLESQTTLSSNWRRRASSLKCRS